MWGALAPQDKARYEELAAKDRERYLSECKESGHTPLAFKNTPTTTTTAAPRRYTLNRASDSESRDDSLLHLDDDVYHTPDPNRPLKRDASVESAPYEPEAVLCFPDENALQGDNGGYEVVSVPATDIIPQTIPQTSENNDEHAAMSDAIEELQKVCDRLKASLDAERQAYFKVKVLLGKRRGRRDAI
jgi:hypothetical protein